MVKSHENHTFFTFGTRCHIAAHRNSRGENISSCYVKIYKVQLATDRSLSLEDLPVFHQSQNVGLESSFLQIPIQYRKRFNMRHSFRQEKYRELKITESQQKEIH